MKHPLLLIILFSLISYPAAANRIDTARVTGGDRWFEVEMIIFQRQHDGNLIEQFNSNDQLTLPDRYFDLLRPLYQSDISPLLRQLELCPAPQTAGFIAEQHTPASMEQPVNLSEYIQLFRPAYIGALCIFEPQPPLWQQPLFATPQWIASTPFPDRLLRQPAGPLAHQDKPYLLDHDSLQFSEIAQKLAQQADIDVLLHSGFRQAPVTDRRSIASRWYAGNDLSKQSHTAANTRQLTTASSSISLRSDPLLARIEQRYQQLTKDEPMRLYRLQPTAYLHDEMQDERENIPLWQLDGFVRVHLDHYLFVNTDFILRQLDEEGAILQHRIQFSRRVISGEMHYIDHPRLGMVLQIRRYQPPTTDTERSNSVQ